MKADTISHRLPVPAFLRDRPIISGKGVPPLVGPRPGSAVDNPSVDFSQCPLAAAYPHWDDYIKDAEDGEAA